MAVSKNDQTATLRLVLKTGETNQAGEAVTKNKNLSNVNSTVSDEIFYNVGQALAGLQALELDQIVRLDQAQLSEQ